MTFFFLHFYEFLFWQRCSAGYGYEPRGTGGEEGVRNSTTHPNQTLSQTNKLLLLLSIQREREREFFQRERERKWGIRSRSGRRRKKKHYWAEQRSTALENGRTFSKILSLLLFSLTVPTLTSRSLLIYLFMPLPTSQLIHSHFQGFFFFFVNFVWF